MSQFKTYQRKVTTGEMRPYIEGEDLSGVQVSQHDEDNGLVKKGAWIARSPHNHDDQWLVSQEYFDKTFNPDPID